MGSIIGRVADHIPMHFSNIIYPPTTKNETKKDNNYNNGTVAFDNVNWHSQIVNNRVVGCSLFCLKSSARNNKNLLRLILYSLTR